MDSVLVGGKHYKMLETSDLINASALANAQYCESSTPGVFVRSVFLPKHGCSGVLYRTGENCLVSNSEGENTVLEISHTFAVEFSDNIIIYVKGTIFSQLA